MTRDSDTRTRVRVRWGGSAPMKAAVLGTQQHRLKDLSSLTYVNKRPKAQQVKCKLSHPAMRRAGTE